MEALADTDFKTIFESLPGLYLILTADFKIIAASDAYIQASMTKREEILGRKIFDVFPDNPDDPAATGERNLRASLERAVKTRSFDAMAVQKYDVRRPESQGGGFEERHWSPTNSVVLGPNDTVRYVIHRVEDVTEFIRLKKKDVEESQRKQDLLSYSEKMEAEVFHRAQELQAANERLEEANRKILESERLKDDFLANVSHELRTPLTLILAPLESLLSKPGERSVEERAFLRAMHNNSIRLLQMITGLLDFSRLQAGKFVVNREPVDIANLTQSMLSDFDPAMKQSQIECRIFGAEGLPLVDVDRYLYERILFNLLSNALKFTPRGGKVGVHLAYRGETFALAVKDTGIGISPRDQPRLFERFRQVEGSSTRRFEGTGLGLALVKEFAELLGGGVSLRSEPGVGSEFLVEIFAPCSSAGAKVRAPGKKLVPLPGFELETDPAATEEAPDKSARVLVAEDNQELASYIKTLIGKTCEVRIAQDGQEALESVRTWNPDLVLTDVMMPRMNGITLCKRIKAEPRTSEIPVVLITALVHRDALLQGWEAGADEYLFKPFHPTELIARIRSLLAGVEARKQRDAEKLRRAELEEFAYFASHDLKEPLRTITTYSQLLKKRYGEKLGTDADSYIRYVVDGAGRMEQLIEGLISYARVNAKDIVLGRASCESALSRALGSLAIAIGESGAKITHAGLPEIEGNALLLTQLFQNLIGNAVKYRRRETARIHVDAKRDGEDWLFSVRDNGIGFESQYAERIFLIFKRLHGPGEYSGTGIGLALCKSIVERHGGRIWAESEPGKGATFWFTLPAAQRTFRSTNDEACGSKELS